MHIDEMMERLSGLPHAVIGLGPAHPKALPQQLETEAEAFLKPKPYLLSHPDYIEFLKRFEAAGIYYPDSSPQYKSLTIFGLGDLRDGFAESVDAEGFYLFATYTAKVNESEEVSFGFGFDATGKRKKGVYKKLVKLDAPNWGKYEYAFGSFSEWLEAVVTMEGNLNG